MKLSLTTKTGLAAMRSAFNNENGAALVIALMFMAILTMLGTTAVVLTTTDMRIGANYKTSVQSYNIGKAGIEEVVHRMGLPSGEANYIGEPSGTGPTPGWGRYVVLQTGSELFKEDQNWDLSGDSLNNNHEVDSNIDETGETYPEIATVQTIDGNELNYLVKAHYKIEDAQFNNGTDDNEVVLYGQDFGYGSKAPLIGTQPVWVVPSIGTSSNNSKTVIIGDYVRFPLNIEAKAALSCDHPPNLGGSTLISGFNHDITTTPADDVKSTIDITGIDLSLDGNGQDNHGGPEKYTGFVGADDNTSLSSDEDTVTSSPGKSNEHEIIYGAKIENDQGTYLPGVWTTDDVVDASGTDDIYGGNNLGAWKDEDSSNTWVELYDLLGFDTQEDFENMLKRADVTMDDTSVSGGNLWLDVAPVGFTYIDNAPTGQVLKFSTLVVGSGLMYITGNLDANNLQFKGLIYVKGSVSLAASFWLLGAMLVEGVDPVGSGGGHILYSKDALDQEVGDAMKFIPISLADESLIQ